MLKFRLRPNRYVQVVSTNKEYRDIALDWLTSNVEGRPVKARATLTLPDGAEVAATAFYGQSTPILKGKLEVLHVSNDKSCLALKPIQPAFSCIWLIPNQCVKNKGAVVIK